MSLRAIHLVLETHEREVAKGEARQAHAMFLASKAKWDRSAAKQFSELVQRLEKIAYPRRAAATPKASTAQLIQLFRAMQIPEAKKT